MNKRAVILGAAESGVGAAILARKRGFEVFVSDLGTIKDKYKKELTDRQFDFEEGPTYGSKNIKCGFGY